MVTRVNGKPEQGMWFEKDVVILQITSDLSDWVEQAGADGGLEQVLEKVAQYGTILGVTCASADDLWVMVGHGHQFTPGNDEGDAGSAEAALAADINAITTPVNYANTTVDTFAGFTGVTPDVAA